MPSSQPPFLDNGEIDFPSIEHLVDFMAGKKVHGLAIMGALGEGHKLTETERTRIIKTYRECLPRNMGLVVGVRAQATDPAKAMVRKTFITSNSKIRRPE
ncbi:MAG: dihydrodipicolinate synthase family protein [Desulfatirhabdiaceae bacterium]